MLVRPRDLADRISGPQQPEKFTLPIEAARCKAREILDQFTHAGYATGGSFPTVRLSSRCDICARVTEQH
jgi:hypothetical protein